MVAVYLPEAKLRPNGSGGFGDRISRNSIYIRHPYKGTDRSQRLSKSKSTSLQNMASTDQEHASNDPPSRIARYDR